jgi:acyl-CoA thioesterase-1
MQMPPSMGVDFVTAFQAIFPAVAKANDATFIPFLLEGVGGESALNQADGIHPNAKGHALIGETVWRVLRPLL